MSKQASGAERVVLVKICGVRTLAGAQAAVDAGADLLGFICYPPARRYLAPEQITGILSRLRSRSSVQAVGVFVNQAVDEVKGVADSCGLDLIQLSGDEPEEALRLFERPVIRAVRVAGSSSATATDDELVLVGESGRRRGLKPTAEMGEAGLSRLVRSRPLGRVSDNLFATLLEPRSSGWGGSGERMDWNRARLFTQLANSAPVFLAGGLTPENVAGAIAAVRPDGVDVSSGVERDGVQDVSRIAAFVAAAKGAAR